MGPNPELISVADLDFDWKFDSLTNLRGLPHGLELSAGVLTGFRVFLHVLNIFSEGGMRK